MWTIATKIILSEMRPLSSTERAKEYDMIRRTSSVSDEKIEMNTTPHGYLVDVKRDLESFEDEPTVDTFMDTSLATTGKLYRLRDHLQGKRE